ncbi:hypothetical protein L596_027106 [Steinernema carpocapsae]|uniref:Uncharacterized protein n=1 Tax=Steinernema carpocapsae TaxID=34508 RepID=A0A4U5M3F3_STECR|nr:hypothetical protein L596_027106 [Steinernema carpocapsae]
MEDFNIGQMSSSWSLAITDSAQTAGATGLKSMIAVELAGLVTFVVLFLVNLKKRKAESRLEASLAYKYQVQENVIGYEVIFPIAFLHCISYTITYIFLLSSIGLFINKNSDIANVTKIIMMCDVTVAYVILFPLMVIYKTFRKIRRPARVFTREPKDQQIKNNTENYFIMLNQQLNK